MIGRTVRYATVLLIGYLAGAVAAAAVEDAPGPAVLLALGALVMLLVLRTGARAAAHAAADAAAEAIAVAQATAVSSSSVTIEAGASRPSLQAGAIVSAGELAGSRELAPGDRWEGVRATEQQLETR